MLLNCNKFVFFRFAYQTIYKPYKTRSRLLSPSTRNLSAIYLYCRHVQINDLFMKSGWKWPKPSPFWPYISSMKSLRQFDRRRETSNIRFSSVYWFGTVLVFQINDRNSWIWSTKIPECIRMEIEKKKMVTILNRSFW